MQHVFYEDAPKIAPLTASMCQHFAMPEYLVSGVLAYGEVACIFGAPGAGKSLLALYIAYMVSRGDPVCGIKTSKNAVLYLAYEDYGGIVRRVAGLHSHYGPTGHFYVDEGISNLYDEDQDGHSFAMSHTVRYVRENKISLVIIDTLSAAFYGIEENDNRSMNRVVAKAKCLADKTGAAVILVHHNTKSDSDTPRGHSVLLGALDVALKVRQPSSGNIEARFTKIKNGSTEVPLSFKIQVENIGVDFDGDAINVAVCEESDLSDPAKSCSKAELAALQILDQLHQSGSVSERDWLEACAAENRVSSACQLADRLRVVRRVAQNLRGNGLIVVVDGRVSRMGQ